MANIYVRKSGSDSNNGSTPALAKLTIASAISAMSSGDTVYVGSGIYREQELSTIKNITIIGDTTGEYTGDAGEVIWSGLNSTDDTYTEKSYGIYSTASLLTINNIIFENWRLKYYTSFRTAVIRHNGGTTNINNCKAFNINSYSNSNTLAASFIDHYTSGTLNINNLYVDGMYGFGNTTSLFTAIYCGSSIVNLSNIYIKNINGTFTNDSDIQGIKIESIKSGSSIKNINISNIYSSSLNAGASAYGLSIAGAEQDVYNVICSSIFSNGKTSSNSVGLSHFSTGIAYNCSVFNIINADSAGTSYQNMSQSNCVNKENYILPKISPISKYSPLIGQGSTTFPTTDIEGNPRPAYGNGTVCDIGASEATSESVQQESVIKDAGDYSAKVAPCNYFKRQFQIPVTASELRTVKVKIRIDGTWGTYRPKATLTGQGMTLSTATKNTTTGSFEELTVSGTPTTTGIALLTVEAHSTNTNSVMYIDSISVE